MTKKFNLLLLDANVVIQLFELGIWDQLIENTEVHLAKTIVDKEAHFYEDDRGNRHDCALKTYINSGKIKVFEIAVSEMDAFLGKFDAIYLDKLDPGETEMLTHLLSKQDKPFLICSADKIVYRVLGNINLSEKGISLEEVLTGVGLGRQLPREFTKEYRIEWSQKGFEENMRGLGRTNL